jgi:hypothetical protein
MSDQAINNLIQTVSLVVAISIFIFQIVQQRREQNNKDARSKVKLRIFFFCQDEARTYEQIETHLSHPDHERSVSKDEINKSVYEMLQEETLRYRDNQTFKARRNRAKKDDSDDQ